MSLFTVYSPATYSLIKWRNGDTQTKKDLVMGLGQNFLLKDGKLTLELHEWFIPIKEKKETGEIQKNTSEPTLTQKKPSDSSESFFWLHFVDDIRNHYMSLPAKF